jgi:hypothetical protein
MFIWKFAINMNVFGMGQLDMDNLPGSKKVNHCIMPYNAVIKTW